MCTRAALTPRIIWIVRASSPSSALTWDQLQDQLSVRIRDAERLYVQLVLDLEGGKLGGGFIHFRIDERSEARGSAVR
jgi:hypothetical protein